MMVLLYNTTFNVDMSCAGTAFYEVFVTGPLWGWPANSGWNQLLDEDGDGIYTVTLETGAGDIEYKYGIDGFAGQENLIDDMQNGASCAPVTDYSGYANRLTASGSTTNDTYGSCEPCPSDVPGCIDETACNYDENATIQSCGDGALNFTWLSPAHGVAKFHGTSQMLMAMWLHLATTLLQLELRLVCLLEITASMDLTHTEMVGTEVFLASLMLVQATSIS